MANGWPCWIWSSWIFPGNFLPEQHILFYRNGLVIWHGLADIRYINLIMADGRPFWIRMTDITHIIVNYGRWSAIWVGEISKNLKGTSTTSEGCVCAKLNKSIHEFPRSASVSDRRWAGLPDIWCYDNNPALTLSGGGEGVIMQEMYCWCALLWEQWYYLICYVKWFES